MQYESQKKNNKFGKFWCKEKEVKKTLNKVNMHYMVLFFDISSMKFIILIVNADAYNLLYSYVTCDALPLLKQFGCKKCVVYGERGGGDIY